MHKEIKTDSLEEDAFLLYELIWIHSFFMQNLVAFLFEQVTSIAASVSWAYENEKCMICVI